MQLQFLVIAILLISILIALRHVSSDVRIIIKILTHRLFTQQHPGQKDMKKHDTDADTMESDQGVVDDDDSDDVILEEQPSDKKQGESAIEGEELAKEERIEEITTQTVAD